MEHSNIVHQLFLHLPLNIFWRIVGWNKTINEVMLKEHFWKEKCKKEFQLIHDKILSYRLYYLIRSENIYGNLYIESSTLPIRVEGLTRVSWAIRISTNKSSSEYVALDNDRLVHITHNMLTQTTSYRVILEEIVERMTEQSTSYLYDYSAYFRLKDGSYRQISSTNPLTINEYIRVNDLISLKGAKPLCWTYDSVTTGYILMDDGRLFKQTQSSISVFREGVVQYIIDNDPSIIISYFDGAIEVIDRYGQYRTIRLFDTKPHIKIREIGDGLVIYLQNGKIETINMSSLYKNNKIKPSTDEERYKADLPIKSIQARMSDQLVIMTIDGSAYHLRTWLSKNHEKLIFERVGQSTRSSVIASRIE